MFTPQEIQEQTFSKAVFGGYDMQQVDDFLEPLTEDYIMLYKENSVLKSKMKVLVEKLEEYRGQEAAMKQQMAQAQAQCDRMIAEAQSRSATIVAGAETTLRSLLSKYHRVLASSSHLLRVSWLRVLTAFKQQEVGLQGDSQRSTCWIRAPARCRRTSASPTR